MTPEQIELEFQHMLLDKQESGEGQVYVDDSFDEYDKETEELDSKLSDIPKFGSEASDPYASMNNASKAQTTPTTDEDEWEDVEIDDFDEP